MSSGLRARLVALFVLAAPLAACAAPITTMNPHEQAAFGARVFAAPFAATFQAARDALAGIGYEVAVADAQAGRITTRRKEAGASLQLGIDGRSATVLWRQYDLRIQAVDPGRTRVIAVPRMYRGERDVSNERVWTFDGHDGERAKWRQLFTAIEAGL